MNNIDVFTVLMFIDIKNTVKIILAVNDLDNKYLWKLLHIRDNKTNQILKYYYDTYILIQKIINNNEDYFEEILYYQNFEYISQTIGSLMNFGFINLQSQNVLPNEISNLVNLHRLTVHGNKLYNLPSDIGKLVNLRDLDIHRNNLQTLPTEIGNLVNMVELYMSYNLLRILPSEIGNMKHLKILYIRYNNLCFLPKEIGNLKELTNLAMIGNPFLFFFEEFKLLEKIRCISIDENNYDIIPSEIKSKPEIIIYVNDYSF